jgi:hypothetical protein
VDTAIDLGFGTLVDAVQAAGLENLLRTTDPLTVFAPTEAAFAALPSDLVAFLLDPANVEFLQELLAYHVIAAEVKSADLKGWQLVQMFNDAYTLVRKPWDGNVYVNFSKVVAGVRQLLEGRGRGRPCHEWRDPRHRQGSDSLHVLRTGEWTSQRGPRGSSGPPGGAGQSLNRCTLKRANSGESRGAERGPSLEGPLFVVGSPDCAGFRWRGEASDPGSRRLLRVDFVPVAPGQ